MKNYFVILFVNICLIFSITLSAKTLDTTVKHISTESIEIIDINKASKEQLQTLHGIGSKRAQAIVDYRKQSGPFRSLDDLQNVKGFSEHFVKKLIDKNRDLKVSVVMPQRHVSSSCHEG